MKNYLSEVQTFARDSILLDSKCRKKQFCEANVSSSHVKGKVWLAAFKNQFRAKLVQNLQKSSRFRF